MTEKHPGEDKLPEEQVVQLRSGRNGLGIVIKGGTDYPYHKDDTGIFISEIKADTPAERCEKLSVGDKILELDGNSLLNKKHSEAVDCFKRSGIVVRLKIRKSLQPTGGIISLCFRKIFSFVDFRRGQPLRLMNVLGFVFFISICGGSVFFQFKDSVTNFFSRLHSRFFR